MTANIGLSRFSTQKMRRDVTGGDRGDGHRLQQEGRRIRRPDPRRIRIGKPDPSLTSAAGLVPFGAFLREIGLDERLRRLFGHLKTGDGVVYPMGSQMRLLIDSNVLGESRVFGLENLAADPLFVHMAGGTVPSIDTVYRDLDRFGAMEIELLEELVAEHGLWKKDLAKLDLVHLDIDTTVEVLFGHQEGALPGPNPRYHGRPSYHPILARIAETRTAVGGRLRPGDTSFGDDDAEYVRHVVRRVRRALRDEQQLRVRIDAAGDCTAVLAAIEDERATFVTKARLTPDLLARVFVEKNWRTVACDTENRPLRQVADIPFARAVWNQAGRKFRVIAVRTREETSGKQVYLWDDLDFTVKVYITNEWNIDADELTRDYNDRAGIEPDIGELKYGLGIGHVPTDSFDANHAMLLLKLLTANLVRRFLRERAPHLWAWRVPWLRRALFRVPGKLVRRGRSLVLRLPSDSFLARLLN
jgi:hypothetical protein